MKRPGAQPTSDRKLPSWGAIGCLSLLFLVPLLALVEDGDDEFLLYLGPPVCRPDAFLFVMRDGSMRWRSSVDDSDEPVTLAGVFARLRGFDDLPDRLYQPVRVWIDDRMPWERVLLLVDSLRGPWPGCRLRYAAVPKPHRRTIAFDYLEPLSERREDDVVIEVFRSEDGAPRYRVKGGVPVSDAELRSVCRSAIPHRADRAPRGIVCAGDSALLLDVLPVTWEFSIAGVDSIVYDTATPKSEEGDGDR